jgi:hydroxymethylbilane synthase
MSQRSIRIATRQSQLALWQANWVKDQLTSAEPNRQVEIIKITTKGDLIQNRPINEIGGKYVFIKALQHALLNNEADIAVHCIKDMSVHQTPGLTLSCVPPREDARDVLISPKNYSLKTLPKGATIGTGSPRRASLIKHLRPDLALAPIRGNIDSRLKKLDDNKVDALILAHAGLKRLNLEHCISERLDPAYFTPAIGQGALGIEHRENDTHAAAAVAKLHDPLSAARILAEQTVNQILGGDCHSAIGAYATIKEEVLTLNAMVASKCGAKIIRSELSDSLEHASRLGEAVAQELIEKGALKLLEQP